MINEQDNSEKKKLGLSSGTLKLSSVASRKLKPGDKAISSRNASGTIIVVTKKNTNKTIADSNLSQKDSNIQDILKAERDDKQRIDEQNSLEKKIDSKDVEQSHDKDGLILQEIASRNKVKNLDSKAAPSVDDEVAKNATKISTPIKEGKHVNKKNDTKKNDREEEVVKKKKVSNQKVSKKVSISQVMMLDDTDKDDLDNSASKKYKKRKKKKSISSSNKLKITREILIHGNEIIVQELAYKLSEKTADVIKKLIQMGVMATINQSIDADTAELVATEMGHKCIRSSDESREQELLQEFVDKAENLLPRPPIVTIMGHVDHGKTSLLDALRETNVAAGESGGITQHIGAYQVQLSNDAFITFLDTPGHEAFTEMRLRGAHVTDIVVLVVAADDGIMEQTIEAISHAKAAEVPIIVAINKVDKADADPQKIKQELLRHELVAEDLGGQVITIEVSAKNKFNLEKLEKAILLQAEMLELSANPHRKGYGSVIESRMDKGRGAIATLLVQNGTLNKGDMILAGTAYGRIKALVNDKGHFSKTAIPAAPVEILGLNAVPIAGDKFHVVTDEKIAREVSDIRIAQQNSTKMSSKLSLEQLFKQSTGNQIKKLSVIIKADVQGSVEAIVNSLEKLSNDEIDIKVLHSGVGGILVSDIMLALASNAIVIGFNVRPETQANDLATARKLDIRYYSVIYHIVDEIKAAMCGLLGPHIKEVYLGTSVIKQVINISKIGKIAGCIVENGVVRRNEHARLIRDNIVIYEGKLKTLRRFKDDVKEVKNGFECGISFEKYDNLQIGDKIEVFELMEEKRQL